MYKTHRSQIRETYKLMRKQYTKVKSGKFQYRILNTETIFQCVSTRAWLKIKILPTHREQSFLQYMTCKIGIAPLSRLSYFESLITCSGRLRCGFLWLSDTSGLFFTVWTHLGDPRIVCGHGH